MQWAEILRNQALSAGEVATRLGKSRPTVLKMLKDAVLAGELESREKDSVVFYSVKPGMVFTPLCKECETATEEECNKCLNQEHSPKGCVV